MYGPRVGIKPDPDGSGFFKEAYAHPVKYDPQSGTTYSFQVGWNDIFDETDGHLVRVTGHMDENDTCGEGSGEDENLDFLWQGTIRP
jgi:hypothetical protein